MVDLHLSDTHAEFVLLGAHRFWALRGRVRVRLDHIREVRADPEALRQGWAGGLWIRVPGTYVPGLIKAGTYRRPDRTEFWDVGRSGRAIVVELEGADFDRLVVDVADPAGAVERLREAVWGRG